MGECKAWNDLIDIQNKTKQSKAINLLRGRIKVLPLLYLEGKL
jgi:hypothetical protein